MITGRCRRWRRAVVFISFLSGSLSPMASAQHPGDMPSNSLLDNPKLSAVTLAKVGPWNVTAQEFLLNYEYGPAFPKREPDSKRRYLTYMIYEKLLALDGYSRGLQSSRMVKEVLDEVKADLATEELYKDDVLDSIHIPEKQIERGVSGENIHLSLRWLYSRSKDEMSRRSALMRDGVSFDSLFALQCPDSASADDRSMETTRFKLEMKNPQFVSAIDTLHVGTVSPPIQGPDGWYVVKIVNAWTNPILTESENQKLHEDVRRALLQHESDSLSDAYVHRMLLRQEPVIDKEAFGFLEAWLGRKFLSPEQYASWGMKEKPAERSRTPDPDSVGQYRNQVLVRMKNGRFLFEDFLSWFKPREPYVRLDTKSLHGYAESVEELIWRMARDRMLTKEAYRRGLQKRKNVAQQVKWWEEKLVYRAVKLEIENGIKQSDSTLHSYYEEHQRDYRNDKGIVRSFEEVKEDVSRDEFAYETTSRLLHQILRLKQKYGVKINDDTLKKLYVDIENSPKAIDVYTVKKGGIFPHTAFPSIDYEWQAWD